MKIAFEPFENKENKYIDIMKSCLSELGYTICSLKNMNDKNCKILVLNWYEDSPYPNDKIKTCITLVKRIARIMYAQLCGKKIIYVMHNKQSHNKKLESRLLQKFLISHADIIQIHSRVSEKYVEKKYRKKVFYIPHPNYIDVYPDSFGKYDRTNLSLKTDAPVLLFVGAIKPYKNIELLLNIAKCYPQIQFLIAGKPNCSEYGEALQIMAKESDNISLLFKFIPDEELSDLLKISDAVILPYDISSSLNSGTIYLAFSNKKTVVAPLIATLEDISDMDFFFGYQYKDESEHEQNLKKAIDELISAYEKNKDILSRMGNDAYLYVSSKHSNEEIKKQYRKMIGRLGI